MLDFSRSSKYGIIDNNLLDFYNKVESQSKATPPAVNHGDGIIDTVISGLKKIKKPLIEGTKEIVKGAAKEGAQQLGSFALRKIVDKVTTKKPKDDADGDDNFIQEEDINAKARRKLLKDLKIHPIESKLNSVESTPSKNLDEIKNVIHEELKKILNIATPETQFSGAKLKLPKSTIPSIRIGE